MREIASFLAMTAESGDCSYLAMTAESGVPHIHNSSILNNKLFLLFQSFNLVIRNFVIRNLVIRNF